MFLDGNKRFLLANETAGNHTALLVLLKFRVYLVKGRFQNNKFLLVFPENGP
jgi:hypothetical protein